MWVRVDRGLAQPVYCRDLGAGDAPLVHLHGGWGHDVYPFDRPLTLLESRFRVLVPDRIGYGRSGRRDEDFSVDFHRRAAAETVAVMDALDVETAVLWGHSDGACIAAWMGLDAPERCRAIVLEALHYDRTKPGSREFFETMAAEPACVGERVGAVLAAEHGDDYWEDLLRFSGTAWSAIRETPWPYPDLFDGRLSDLTPPVLVLHGAEDPRTEPGELDAVRQALPRAAFALLEEAGHSPHSEDDAWRDATRAVLDFLDR